MKTLVILFLVLSSLFLVACTATQPTAPDVEQPEAVGEDEVIQDIDDSLIQEEDDIEIGDMI